MSEQKKQAGLWPTVLISAIILAGVVIWSTVKHQSAEQTQVEHRHQNPFEAFVQSTDDVNPSKMSLNDVIKVARTWGPAYTSWAGKTAPDFTLTDITGKQHKLSDYRGKDVMIVFWATWCAPCKIEIPHLIALRNTIGEDKLAMLAISNEKPALVKEFVENQKINYTVFSTDTRAMPAPFNRIRGIPCSFFINPEGKIKLATEGLLSLGAVKAILLAE
jgi:peroxiredoxin